MKYPVMLFDADGVMITSSRLFSEQLELDYGISVKKMQPFFTGVFKLCSIGQADLKQELEKVISDWGWQGTVDELLDFWFSKGTVIDQEMLTFVQSLKRDGVRCFMTTDQEKYRGGHLRRTIGQGNPFEDIFFSAELGCPKKDPRFFAQVYQHIQQTGPIEKKQTLFVDDSPENVAVAQRFGFVAYQFSQLPEFKAFLAQR